MYCLQESTIQNKIFLTPSLLSQRCIFKCNIFNATSTLREKCQENTDQKKLRIWTLVTQCRILEKITLKLEALMRIYETLHIGVKIM